MFESLMFKKKFKVEKITELHALELYKSDQRGRRYGYSN